MTETTVQEVGLSASHSVPHPLRDQAVVVMPYTQGLRAHASHHERLTHAQIARRLAHIKGCGLAEELPQALWMQRAYLIPCETLVSRVAYGMGVFGEDDLFGGVVPHPFVATKAITHPLVSPTAAAPEGWTDTFPREVTSAVLPGYTAFNRQNAAEAGQKLLALGPVRIKPATETGGHGQTIAHDLAELTRCLAALTDDSVHGGVVLEQNLAQVTTLSVGQVRVGGIVASYHGRQNLTRDNTGAVAYGGSDLTVVRGDFEALLATLPPGPERTAVDQALVYDTAASRCFDGFFASRVNYDVAQGLDADGEWRSGVLEQSWRVGGASGAEVAALEAFHADPGLHAVKARCVEVFGALQPPPPSAVVYFQGEDPEVGLLTKYALVYSDGDEA